MFWSDVVEHSHSSQVYDLNSQKSSENVKIFELSNLNILIFLNLFQKISLSRLKSTTSNKEFHKKNFHFNGKNILKLPKAFYIFQIKIESQKNLSCLRLFFGSSNWKKYFLNLILMPLGNFCKGLTSILLISMKCLWK